MPDFSLPNFSRPDSCSPTFDGAADMPIATSPAMQAVIQLLNRVMDTPLPVLLNGETGVGKGVLSRYLHTQSRRSQAKLMSIICAAIPPNLIESELFGYEKGAFTGASTQRIGLFELADGGTLFLDEINSAPHDVQVRLLHFLQDKSFFRVGGTRAIHVDVRLIAASNQPLKTLVARGEFRQDLFYRLNVFPVEIPPLRERTEDIPLLGLRILSQLAPQLGKVVRSCGQGVLTALQQYPWPGNVRELENIIQRALVMAQGERIELDDLPAEVRQPHKASSDDEITLHLPREATLAEVERRWILRVLDLHAGNRTHAAEQLGIDPSTLWRKLR